MCSSDLGGRPTSPGLDWGASGNLASTELLFPAPTRFTAFDIENFGYGDAVTFPIQVALESPGQPARLATQVRLLVCKDICIPEDFSLTLDLPQGTGIDTAAAETLAAIAANGEVPQIYRDIAAFRMLLLQSDSREASERRTSFEALARAGSPLRLLAEEQIALIEVETGDTEAAIARFQSILADAEVTAGLRQRVSQVIVALGGDPQMGTAAPAPQTDTVPALDADNN